MMLIRLAASLTKIALFAAVVLVLAQIHVRGKTLHERVAQALSRPLISDSIAWVKRNLSLDAVTFINIAKDMSKDVKETVKDSVKEAAKDSLKKMEKKLESASSSSIKSKQAQFSAVLKNEPQSNSNKNNSK